LLDVTQTIYLPDEIADMFALKYQSLYNSVPCNVDDLKVIREEMFNSIAQRCHSQYGLRACTTAQHSTATSDFFRHL
jgi:hypothetical protein